MALNRIYAGTDRKNRTRVVPSGTVSGDFLLIDGRPAVALTSRGDATKSESILGYTLSGIPSGGVGLEDDEATVAFDGTYALPVNGVTTATESDVAVYIDGSGDLTLTETNNDLFGYTDYPVGYNKVADEAPVRIGE